MKNSQPKMLSIGSEDIFEQVNNLKKEFNEEKKDLISIDFSRKAFDNCLNGILVSKRPLFKLEDFIENLFKVTWWKKRHYSLFFGLFGNYVERYEEYDHLFLNDDERESFQGSFHIETPDGCNSGTFGPDYKLIDKLLTRVESRTLDKVQFRYKENCEEIIDLSWLMIKDEINSLNDSLNGIIKELIKEIIHREQEINGLEKILNEKLSFLNKAISEKNQIIVSLEQQKQD